MNNRVRWVVFRFANEELKPRLLVGRWLCTFNRVHEEWTHCHGKYEAYLDDPREENLDGIELTGVKYNACVECGQKLPTSLRAQAKLQRIGLHEKWDEVVQDEIRIHREENERWKQLCETMEVLQMCLWEAKDLPTPERCEIVSDWFSDLYGTDVIVKEEK